MTAGRGALRDLVAPTVAIVGALTVGALLLERIAGGASHVGELALRCLRVPLALLDAGAHLGVLVNTGLLAFVGLAIASVFVRQARQARSLGRAVSRARLDALPPAVSQAAAAAGVLDRVDVVGASRPFAFVYGWMAPRICVSTGLAELLSPGELRAALLHERWHVMRRDPVRLTVAASIRSAFRFLPSFPQRAEQYAVAVEIAADRFVISEMGHPQLLAAALLRLEPGPVAPAFAGRTEPRVAALVEGTPGGAGRSRWVGPLLAAELAALVLLAVPRLTVPIGAAVSYAC